MLEIKELSVSYCGIQVLRSIDLKIEPGKVTALIGPNGCGKSTLLKTVAGVIKPDSGRVKIDGTDALRLTHRQLAQRVSYMAQNRSTPNIIAKRMVLHGRFPYLSYPRQYTKKDYEAANGALREAEAEDIAERAMAELSGGQRQKVYLAMTLAQDTGIILMDEPMNFLDIHSQLTLTRLARRLAESGKTVLFVMHDIRIALQMADWIVVMADGEIKAEGAPGEVFETGVLEKVFNVKMRRIDTEDGVQYYYGGVAI